MLPLQTINSRWSDLVHLLSSSEFGALLASNDIPTDEQSRMLRSLSEATTTKISQLQNESPDVPRTDELHQLQQQVKTILHPVRRMPYEILGMIFLSVVDEWYIGPGAHDVDWETTRMFAPWKLAAVSQQWRAVALSLPALWSSAVLHWPLELDPTFLKLHLERSASTPLSIVIFTLGFEADDALLQTLLPTAHRWQRLTLDSEAYDPPFTDIKPSLSALESLDLSIGVMTTEWPVTLFDSAPKLRFVAGDAYTLYRSTFPWTQLVGYHETGPNHPDIDGADGDDYDWEHWTTMQSLRYCKITFNDTYRYPSQPLCWNQLQQLCVNITEAESAEQFVKTLSLPQLTHLTVHSDSEALAYFDHFPTVQHLFIYNMMHGYSDHDESVIAAIVTSMPRLVSLCIFETKLSVSLLRSFLQTVAWPHIETIHHVESFQSRPNPSADVCAAAEELVTNRPGVTVWFSASDVPYRRAHGFVYSPRFPEFEQESDTSADICFPPHEVTWSGRSQ